MFEVNPDLECYVLNFQDATIWLAWTNPDVAKVEPELAAVLDKLRLVECLRMPKLDISKGSVWCGAFDQSRPQRNLTDLAEANQLVDYGSGSGTTTHRN